MIDQTINDQLDKLMDIKIELSNALQSAGYNTSGGFTTFGTSVCALTSTAIEGISEISLCVDSISADVKTIIDRNNDIGLSAATIDNKIVTQNDIKNITGAMHFRGSVTPSQGQDVIDAINQQITDPINGDIVIITTTSKQYIYDGSTWIQFGNESIYATKEELKTLSTTLSADYTKNINDSFNIFEDYVDNISSELSSDYQEKINSFDNKYITKTDTQVLSSDIIYNALKLANSYTDTVSTAIFSNFDEEFDNINQSYLKKEDIYKMSTDISVDYNRRISTAKLETYNEALSDANKYTDGKIQTINQTIEDINSSIAMSVEVSCSQIVNSTWYVKKSNIKLNTQTGLNGYSQLKFVVDGGKKYHFNTFINASMAIGLFKYDESFDTPIENSISCLASAPSLENPGFYEADLIVPSDESKYILGISNKTSGAPTNGLSNEQVKVICYDSDEIKIHDVVEDSASKINQISNTVENLKNAAYVSKKIKYSEAINSAWFTAGSGKMHFNQSTQSWAAAYSALKYVIDGGKTYKIKTYLMGQGAVGVFKYTDDLSVPDANSLLTIYSKANSDPGFTYEATVEIPALFGKCILAVSGYPSQIPNDNVEVIDLQYTAADIVANLNETIEDITSKITYISNEIKIDEDMQQYYNKSQFDYLCADTSTSWVYGTFDKAKLVFTVDDGRTDAGYIAQFLSSEYGFPMCFAVPVNSIKNILISSYIEDNGDGTTSTYICNYNYLSDLLIAEEDFGGETYAHDCSKGRWMLSVDGQGLFPKFTDRMAEYYFIEARSALQKLGLQVDGFVSPWHDNLDCYIATMSKYFKYARWSTRSYPNMPYQIPYKDISNGTLAQWKNYIDQAITNKTLLMAYTHGIGGSAEFKMKDLKAIFDYIKEKVDAGLLDVTTLKALRRQYCSLMA